MKIFLLTFIFLIPQAFAKTPSLCDLLDLKNCESVTKQGRRASSVSLPSPTTSIGFNPATVSFDRGLGVEAISQAGNPAIFGIASGTGKVGGALISSSLENSFFSNRIPEIEDNLTKRLRNRKQFKTKKMTLAAGAKIFRKKHFNLDFGLLVKRHSEIKKVNPGAGLSGRIRFLTFGFSVYQDDFYHDYRGHNLEDGTPLPQVYGRDTYKETFNVNTFSFGTKLGDLALDWGHITNRYKFTDEKQQVNLYSASYVYRFMMLNFAIRNEKNSLPKFDGDKTKFEESSTNYFGGVQFSLGRHLIAGLNYNYFLLKEVSLITTLFF